MIGFLKGKWRRVLASLLAVAIMLPTIPAYALGSYTGTRSTADSETTTNGTAADAAARQQVVALLNAMGIEDYSEEDLDALASDELTLEDYTGWTTEELTSRIIDSGVSLSEQQLNALTRGTTDVLSALRNNRVRMIVELEGAPVIRQETQSFSTSGVMSATARSAQVRIQAQQAAVESSLASVVTGPRVNVIYHYTLLTNALAVDATIDQMDEIASVSGVSNVYVDPVYTSIPTDAELDSTVEDSAAFTVYQSGSSTSYTGAGQVIAVIDSGIDTDHEAFANAPASQTITSDTLAAMEVTQLNAYKLLGSADASSFASSVHLSGKIPFRFNYADESTYVDHDKDDETDHGTHVAGITAGYAVNAEGAVTFAGTAPNAQLVVMKVFGANRSGQWSDILAALEDCVVLGVDVVNMSLGSVSGFSDFADTYTGDTSNTNTVFTNLENAGIVVCCAAGNDYTSAYGNRFGNNLALASNPDNNILSKPGSISSTLAVASAASETYFGNSVQVTTGDGVTHKIAYTNNYTSESRNILKFKGQTKGLVVLQSANGTLLTGTPTEFDTYCANGEIKDKFVAVKRGQTFTTTAALAEKYGAIGLIVYDHSSGSLSTMAENTEVSIPAIFISKADGAVLCDYYSEAKDAAVITISATAEEIDNADFGSISDFSSQGVTNDLKLKPEITGLGGLVYSATGDGSYGLKSGTSMATPYTAGIVASLKEALEARYASNPEQVTKQLMTNLLMSSAVPLTQADNNNTLYSPRRQGAGLVNLANAVNTPAYLAAASGLAKLDLGDKDNTGAFGADGKTLTLSFDVKRTGASTEPLTYAIDMAALTEAILKDQSFDYTTDYWNTETGKYEVITVTRDFMSGKAYQLAASFTVSGNGVTAADGGYTLTLDAGTASTTLTVTVKLTDGDIAYLNQYENGIYVDGYVFLKSLDEGGVDLSIPFLSFYGNWVTVPVFDEGTWSDGLLTNPLVDKAVSSGTSLSAAVAQYAPVSTFATSAVGTYYKFWGYLYPLGTTPGFYKTAQDWYGSNPNRLGDYTEEYDREDAIQYTRDYHTINQYAKTQNYFSNASSISHNALSTTRALDNLYQQVWYFPNWSGTQTELYNTYMSLPTQAAREAWLTANGKLAYNRTSENLRKSYYYNSSVGVLPTGYFSNEDSMDWFAAIYPSDENGQSTCTWSSTDTSNNYPSNVEWLPDGTQCLVVLTATPDYSGLNASEASIAQAKYQNTIAAPVKVDNAAPDLKDIDLEYAQDEDGTEHLYYTARVKDNNPVEAISLYIGGNYRGSVVRASVDIPVPYGKAYQDADGYIPITVDLMSDNLRAAFAPYGLANWDAIHFVNTNASDFAFNNYLTVNGERPKKSNGEAIEDAVMRPYTTVSITTNTKVLSQSRSLQMTATGAINTSDYEGIYPNNIGWNDSIQYVSLNPEYATVTPEGKVTAVYTHDTKTHVATIRAYSAAFPNVYQDFYLTVTPYVLQKQVDEADAEIGLRYQGGDVTETITIEKDVIIDMGGATITSIAGSPAFNIDNGAHVTLRNATIIADSVAYADDAELLGAFLGDAPSAIRVLNGHLKLEQCTVYGSKTTVDGQELYTGSAVELMDGSTLTVRKSELHGVYAVNNAVSGQVKGGLTTIEDGTFFGTAAAVKNYVTGETVTYAEGTSAYDTNAYFTDKLTQGAVSTGFELAADPVSANWGGVTFTAEEILTNWTPVGCTMTMNDDGSVRVTMNQSKAYIECNLPAEKQFVGTGASAFGGETRLHNNDGSTTQRRLDVYWEPSSTTSGYIWLREAQGVAQSDLKSWGSSHSSASNATWRGQNISYLKLVFNTNFVANDYVDIGYFSVYPAVWSYYGAGTDTINASTTVLTAVKDAAASSSASGTKVYMVPDETNLVSDSLTKADKSFYSRFGYRWVPSSVTLADGTTVALSTDEFGSYFENTSGQDYTVNCTLQSALSEEEKNALLTACADTDTAKAFLETFVTERLGKALGIDQLDAWTDQVAEMAGDLRDGLIARDAMHWDTPYGESPYKANVENGMFTKENTGLPTDLYFLGSPAYGDKYAQNSVNSVGPMWGIPLSGTFYKSATATAAISNTSGYDYKASSIANIRGAKEKFLTSPMNAYQNAVDGIKSCTTLAEQLAWLSKNYNEILLSAYNLISAVKYNNAANSAGSSYNYSGKESCYYDYIDYSGIPSWLSDKAITLADVEASYGTKYNPGKNWIGEPVENYNPFEDETLLNWLIQKGIKQQGETLRDTFDYKQYTQLGGKILAWCQTTSATLSKLDRALNATPVNTVVSHLDTTHNDAYLNAVSDADNVYSVVGSQITQKDDVWYLNAMGSENGTSLAEFQFTASFQLGSYVVKAVKYRAGEVIADPMAGAVDPVYTYAWYKDEEHTIPVTFDEALVMPMNNVTFYGTATSKLDEDIAQVEAGGTFTLQQNYSGLSFTTYIDKDITLVTNGYSVDTSGTAIPVFTVTNGATLTLRDSSVSRMVCVEDGAALVLDNSSLLSSEYPYAVSGSGTVKFLSGSAAAGITAAIAPTVTIDPGTQPFGYLDNMEGAYFADQLTAEEKSFLQSLKGDSLYDENILFYADADITDSLYAMDDGAALQVSGKPITASDSITAMANTVNGTAVTSGEQGYTVTLSPVSKQTLELAVDYTVSGNQWTAEFGSFAADLGLTLSSTAKEQLIAWDAAEANAQEKLASMLDAIENYEGNSYVKAFVSEEVASMKAYANAIQAELNAYEAVTGDAEKLIAYYALIKKTDFTVPDYYTGTFAGAFDDLSEQIKNFDSLVQAYAMILQVSVDSSGKIPAAGDAMALCSVAIGNCANAPLLDITLAQAEKLMAVDTTSTTHGIENGGSITVNAAKTFALYPLTILNDNEDGDQYGATRYYQQGTDLAAALADVSREGYRLTWQDELGQDYTTGYPMPAMPATALTLIAAWTADITTEQYTVTWVDSSGNTISSINVDSGTELSTLSAPEAPEKAPSASCTYQFAGWSMTSGAITTNTVITPTYQAVLSTETADEVQSSAEKTVPEDLLKDDTIEAITIEMQVKHSGESDGKTVGAVFDKNAVGIIAKNLEEILKENAEAVVSLAVHALENAADEALLNDQQRETLTSDAVIFDLSLTAGGQKIAFSEESGSTTVGNAVVSLPFSGNEDGKTVYYVDETGAKYDMKAVYENGAFTFETSHFSVYAIMDTAETPDDGVKYQVYHRLEVLSEPGTFKAPSPAYRDTLYAPAGTSVTPAVRDIEGFTAPATQTVEVAADGTTKVYYDYTRNSYTVTYTVDDEWYRTDTYLYEEAVTEPAEPEKEGYAFSGWTWSTGSAPSTMPAQNVTAEGTFTANQYSITYQINGTTIYTQYATFGSSVIMPTLYSGNAEVLWDQTLTTMPAEDVTVSASVSLPDTETKTFEDGTSRAVPTDDYVFTLLAPGKVILYAPDFTKDGHTWTAQSLTAKGTEYTFEGRTIEIPGTYQRLTSAVNYAVTILEVDESNESLMTKLATMASIHQMLLGDADSMLGFLNDNAFKNLIYKQVSKERMDQFMADVTELKTMMTCFTSDSAATNEEKLEQLVNQYDRYAALLNNIQDVMDKINTKLHEDNNYSDAQISYPEQLEAFETAYPHTLSASNQISAVAPEETDYSSYHSYTVTVKGMRGEDEPVDQELQESQFTNYVDAATIQIGSDLSFTVTCDQACMVAYTTDGGETYTRLTAAATDSTDTYSFTLTDPNAEIAVVLVGDMTLDGQVDSTDAMQILRYSVKLRELTALESLGADIDADGDVNSTDAMQILRYVVKMRDEFQW